MIAEKKHRSVWGAASRNEDVLAPAPKKSLSSLSIVDVVIAGEAAAGREVDAATPQGSDKFAERLPSLPRRIDCELTLVGGCHGSLDGLGVVEE